MIVENNWLQTNILERSLVNRNVDLKVKIEPYQFKQYTFNVACSRATRHIGRKYPKIYLALSGGLDSSHVFKTLMKNKADIDFTPVIVKIKNNKSNAIEVARAIQLCSEYEVKPKIIRTTEQECIKTYWDKIHKPAGGIGIYAMPLYMVGELAKKNNAVVISGEHIINSFPNPTTDMISSEYDFYLDYINPDILIPFYLYSLEIVNATAKYAIDNDINPSDLRSALYNTKEQTVVNSYDQVNDIIKAMVKHFNPKGSYYKYGSFKDFYKYLEPWRK